MTDELLRRFVDGGRRAQVALDDGKCPHCGCHGALGRFVKRCQDESCGRIWIPGGAN